MRSAGRDPFRRAYIRVVIDQVGVADREIRIHGRQSNLERLVMGRGETPARGPGFVREWRASQELNSRALTFKRLAFPSWRATPNASFWLATQTLHGTCLYGTVAPIANVTFEPKVRVTNEKATRWCTVPPLLMSKLS